MEETNKAKIRQHLTELVESTICSTKFLAVFLSKNVFAKTDVQQIQIEERNYGPDAAAKKFYDLLENRSGSFEVLLNALNQTNQSGVIRTLNVSPGSVQKQKVPLKFSSRRPNYIDEYIEQPVGQILIVCSENCKITCDRILESCKTCKFYSVVEILNTLSMSTESNDRDTILLTNLEDNLVPIYSIEQPIRLKAIFVTSMNKIKVRENLPTPLEFWKVLQDNISWNDLSPFTKHDIITGLITSLSLDAKDLTAALKKLDSKAIYDLINGKFPTPENLFLETIPQQISYYVKRTLQTRYIITKQIFEVELENEFVLISGLDRHGLSELCGKKVHETSSNLLRNKTAISKFILLENKEDFQIICKQFPEKSVHLLDHQSAQFIWKETRGHISTMQKYVAAEQHTLTESEFISGILSQAKPSHICLSDTPGKGKSILLAQLAHEMKKHHDNRIVAFIVIKDLMERLKQFKGSSIAPSSVELETSLLLSKSTIGQIYLNADKNYLRELMLDSFDEIDADDTDFAFECIKIIRTVFSDTRIWIASRPHMLPELEICLETLGYNITPFKRPDQINFLASFWANRIEQCDQKIISTFACQCLETLQTTLDNKQDEVTGIPLQCQLIAEAFEEDARRFLKSNSSQEATTFSVITSISDLYKRVIEKKLAIFRDRYNINKIGKSQIFKAHMRMAMKVIYPSYLSTFSEYLIHGMSSQEMFDCGLVEATSVLSNPRFIHRTFAEYFVALFVLKLLNKYPNQKIAEVFLIDVLSTDKANFVIRLDQLFYQFYPQQDIVINFAKFRQNVICYFLNTFLQHSSLKLKDKSSAVLPIAEACVYHNMVNIYSHILPENVRRDCIVNERFLVKAVVLAAALARCPCHRDN